MSIQVACLNCKKLLRVSEELVGKHIRCPSCASSFPVEATNARPDTPDAVTEQPIESALPAPPRERRRERDYDDRPYRDRDRYDEDNPYRKREDEYPAGGLIPYKNGKALAAYYCGVFSLIPCLGLILGPIAFILGILGFRYASAHPEARGMGHAIAGIILGALTTLLNLAPVGFLVVMIIKEGL